MYVAAGRPDIVYPRRPPQDKRDLHSRAHKILIYLKSPKIDRYRASDSMGILFVDYLTPYKKNLASKAVLVSSIGNGATGTVAIRAKYV